MPSLKIHMTPADLAPLDEHLDSLRARCTDEGRPVITREWFARVAVRADLARRRRAHKARAAKMFAQFLPVVRAVAARWFSALKGSIPIEDLQSAAYEEGMKGALKFRPEAVGATWEALGGAPAPYLRRWAEFGVRALVSARREEGQEMRPDQEEPGRWERLGGEQTTADPTLAPTLRAALATFGSPRERRVLRLLADGLDYDTITARTRLSAEEIRALVSRLQAHLTAAGVAHAPDEELSIAQAAHRFGVSPKSIAKRLRSGKLRGRKLDGEWLVMASEVMEGRRKGDDSDKEST